MARVRARVVAPLVAVALAAGGWYFWSSTRQTAGPEALTTSGTIEATEVPVASEVAGKVLEVLVQEGSRVKPGEALVRLDTAALSLQLEQAQASLRLAEAKLAEAKVGPRAAQVRQAEELAQQAAAAFGGALKNYETVKQLYEKGVAPKTQFDTATTQRDTAEAQAQAARAQADLVKQGATTEQLRQLEAAVAQARAVAELAQYNVDRATVKAPVGGVVVRRLVEPGALVPAGASLLTLANLDDLWLRVYVPENQLNLVRLGQRVEVSVDAYPGRRFTSVVSYISDQAEFTPRNVQTRKERVTTVYAAKLRLTDGLAGELKPGMPADVTFVPEKSAGK
ncbi:MAG: HlyD family secretion protein [Methanocella sp.]